MHWLLIIIGLAALVQLLAAFFALRLIRVTGGRTAWVLIALALGFMALRRGIKLWRLLAGDLTDPPDFFDDATSLAISLCMLAAVWWIPPLFLTIQRAAETLKQAKDQLEIKVAARTEELRDTNIRLSMELEERRQAEEKMAQYAAELQRSNAELEQFAYVASHDLQEPLRMVASFTQLLAKRYQGKLDQDADEFIGFAVDGAHRMQMLINDLLAFSRVETRGKPLEPTDCEAVLSHTLADLAAMVQESGAVVTHDPLPTVPADTVQMGQIFQNLLINALKFKGGETPKVHIFAQRQGDEWLFGFQDNGIGIDPQHQERIFAIFQRLHRREDIPGTGLGLALCKKIAERHGGRIWVESEPGRGSTFYFTIPGGKEDDQNPEQKLPAH
jgi:light-regulated signal transduction histidine kinase (bacteriophytochrome)